MAYSTCALVAQLIPNLLNNASSFDNLPSTVVPGSAQLIRYMNAGCALIEAKLKSRGVTPGTGTVLDSYLADLEASYAAYRAELTRGSPRTAMGERTRAQHFKREFDDGLKELDNMDLAQVGFTHSGKWYIGGVSKSERDSVESDTDRMEPRFKRGQFDGDIDTTSACS